MEHVAAGYQCSVVYVVEASGFEHMLKQQVRKGTVTLTVVNAKRWHLSTECWDRVASNVYSVSNNLLGANCNCANL